MYTSAFACHVKIQLDNNYHNRNVTRSIVINTADGQGQLAWCCDTRRKKADDGNALLKLPHLHDSKLPVFERWARGRISVVLFCEWVSHCRNTKNTSRAAEQTRSSQRDEKREDMKSVTLKHSNQPRTTSQGRDGCAARSPGFRQKSCDSLDKS